MKNLVCILITILICSIFLNCGADGEDGKAYICVDWVFTPVVVNIPDIDTYGGYYYAGRDNEIDPGDYWGEYIAWDDSYWSFTYEIEINEGEKGSFAHEGADGEDKYYEIWLYSFGHEIYVEDKSIEKSENELK